VHPAAHDNAGAIDDAVDAARLGGAARHRIGHRRFVRDISCKGEATRLASDVRQRFGAAVEQYQRSTFCRKKLCGTPADPGRRAGDQDPTLLQATGLSHRSFPSRVLGAPIQVKRFRGISE
jgi:hypothetical protein